MIRFRELVVLVVEQHRMRSLQRFAKLPDWTGLRYYRSRGVKFIVQGGEKHEVTGHSFVAEASYEGALGRDATRVVSCNTTSVVRTLTALKRAGLLRRDRPGKPQGRHHEHPRPRRSTTIVPRRGGPDVTLAPNRARAATLRNEMATAPTVSSAATRNAAHRMRAHSQLADQHIEGGFQRSPLVHGPLDTTAATVTQARGCAYYRDGEDRRQRQQYGGGSDGTGGDAANPTRSGYDAPGSTSPRHQPAPR
jgi:hypothetical protein